MILTVLSLWQVTARVNTVHLGGRQPQIKPTHNPSFPSEMAATVRIHHPSPYSEKKLIFFSENSAS